MHPPEWTAFAGLHPRFEAAHRLLVLELDHGKANEMGSGELDALEALCAHLEGDDAAVCLCTTSRRRSGSGKPLFIAGANVTERGGWGDDRVKAHVRRQRALMERLRRLPLYTVALSHGVTLGWGVEFVLTADYALATAEATFGLPETGLGIIPGARGTADLASRVGPAQALRLGCTGEVVGGEEALRIGLVQELCADVDAGLGRVRAIADLLRRRSPTAIAAFKRGLLAAQGEPTARRLELEAEAYERCIDSGEAALGRRHFDTIRSGGTPEWGPRIIGE